MSGNDSQGTGSGAQNFPDHNISYQDLLELAMLKVQAVKTENLSNELREQLAIRRNHIAGIQNNRKQIAELKRMLEAGIDVGTFLSKEPILYQPIKDLAEEIQRIQARQKAAVALGFCSVNVFKLKLVTELPLASVEDFYGPSKLQFGQSYEQRAHDAVLKAGGTYTVTGTVSPDTGFTELYKCELKFRCVPSSNKYATYTFSMTRDNDVSPLTLRCKVFQEILRIVDEIRCYCH